MRSRRALVLLTVLLLSAGPTQSLASAAAHSPTLVYLALFPVPPADSLAYRQAIAYTINRPALVALVQPRFRDKRVARAATRIEPPQFPAGTPDAIAYPYDPRQARALWAQAGASGPITMRTPSGAGTTQLGQLLDHAICAQIARAFGVQCAPSPGIPATVYAESRAGARPLFRLGWVSRSRNPDFPSFLLGLVSVRQAAWLDARLITLYQQHDSAGVETVLLKKAWIIPLYWTW